jgi:hypothetical protein
MLRLECYTSVREVPCSIWERFVLRGAVGLEIGHLQAIEVSRMKTWKPDFMNIRMVEVGHIASLGSTIEVLQPYLKNFLQVLPQS